MKQSTLHTHNCLVNKFCIHLSKIFTFSGLTVTRNQTRYVFHFGMFMDPGQMSRRHIVLGLSLSVHLSSGFKLACVFYVYKVQCSYYVYLFLDSDEIKIEHVMTLAR